MTTPTDPTITSDPQRFQQTINHFTQSRFDIKGQPLSEEVLDTPVVLGIITSGNSPQPTIATLQASVLMEYIQISNPLFVRGHNTPFAAGSRQDYRVILAFDDEATGESLKDVLGISHFEVHTFREILEAGLRGDAGIALWNEKAISIIEADRVNEYGRVSLPKYEKTETGNVLDKLSDVSDQHNLRPEELAELEALLARQDWFGAPPLLGSAKFEGIKANLLLVTPKPGLERDEVIRLVQELGNTASQIKTPFIVVPVGGKPPVERGGL